MNLLSSNSIQDSVNIYRHLSVLYSQNGDALNACNYMVKYMRSTSDMSILNDHVYSNIKDQPEYKTLKEKYGVKFNGFALLYIFSGNIRVFHIHCT